MTLHANVRTKETLNRSNYIQTFKCDFPHDQIQDFINNQVPNALKNYDINIKRFSEIDSDKFDHVLNQIIETYQFKQATDLVELKQKTGYYIMVLDNYNQAYIGKSIHIDQRIRQHWNHKVPLDRLIFGSVSNSILSIDSFRNQDTTRLFYKITSLEENLEDDLINAFPKSYILNRTAGGMYSLDESINERHTISKKSTARFSELTRPPHGNKINPNKHRFLNYISWLFSKN